VPNIVFREYMFGTKELQYTRCHVVEYWTSGLTHGYCIPTTTQHAIPLGSVNMC